MPHDLSQYLPLKIAMRLLPQPPHLGTGYRWAMRGCRGVKLKTYLVGGTRCTTAEDLRQFIEQVTAAAGR